MGPDSIPPKCALCVKFCSMLLESLKIQECDIISVILHLILKTELQKSNEEEQNPSIVLTVFSGTQAGWYRIVLWYTGPLLLKKME